MDLKIAGKQALMCAASRGLGRACAISLAREGVHLTLVARGAEALAQTAAEIRQQSGVAVSEVAADITCADGRAQALAACPNPDILVNNAGGPPPGDFRQWTRDDWIAALDANMLTPIELIKATVDGMQKRGFGRIVNITSAAVKAPIEVLGLSNGARAGLSGFIAGLARSAIARDVTINNLLPGAFMTDRLHQTLSAEAARANIAVDQAAAARVARIPAGRFGDPAEFGEYCAWLCSAQAGYVTGQNLLIDGGTYPGTF